MSRGEASNLLMLLMQSGIIEYRRLFPPLSPSDHFIRRFHTTTLHVRPLEDLPVWEEPELCPFMHFHFAPEFNYPFLFNMFSTLLEHEHTAVPPSSSLHTQILEKTLVVIYQNIDFFCGERRYQVPAVLPPHSQLFRDVLLPHAPVLFSHWSPNVRQVFHRILVYKMYHSRRAYLPVCNSCEWLAILFGVFRRRYSKVEDARDRDVFAEIESIFGITVDVDKKVKEHLFRIDQESEGCEGV